MAVAADDTNIIYSPYNWDVSAVRALSVNPGAYFRVLLTGASTGDTLNFDTTGISNLKIAYRVDQGAWTFAAPAATIALTFAGNDWSKHLVEVVFRADDSGGTHRWDPPTNSLRFTGITTAGTAVAMQRRGYNVLVYGDSITEGVRTLGATGNDALQGWAYRLGELLGAEVGVVGFGGQGVEAIGQGYVPVFTTTYNKIWSDANRSFAVKPDIIVINQGTNDGLSGTWQAALDGVVTALLAATVNSTSIALMCPLGATAHATELQAIAAAHSSRVKYIPTTGWMAGADTSASHPLGYTNVARIAPLLAAQLKTLLRRPSYYVKDADGNASAITAISVPGSTGGGGGVGSFLPSDMPGIVGWWEADAIGGVADGGAVPSWTSSLGSAFTQATGAAQPLFITAALNGLPVVRFDGVDDLLSASAASADGQPLSLFAVVKMTASANYSAILDNGNGLALYKHNAGNKVMGTNGAQLVAGSGDIADGSFHVVGAIFNGASSKLYRDGTEVASGSTGGAPGVMSSLKLGNATFFFAGDVAAIVCCGATATADADRDLLEAYWADKYALTIA